MIFLNSSPARNGLVFLILHCISLTQPWNVLSITLTHLGSALQKHWKSVPLCDSLSSSLNNGIPHNKKVNVQCAVCLIHANTNECCFCDWCVCVWSFQSCEWRAAEREVLVRGPAASVWDHPSGKKTRGHSKHLNRPCVDINNRRFKNPLCLLCRQPCTCAPVFLFIQSVSTLVLYLDTEHKVICNIRQLILCVVPMVTALSVPGLGVEGPPWNPAEWIGRIVARNCAFTSFPNGLWFSVRPTFTNEHLFLLIAPFRTCALHSK